MSEGEVKVSIEVVDSSEAREVEKLLASAGARDVETSGEGKEGIVPVLIVVGAVLAVTALADAFERWRKNHMCQEIIDARKEGEVEIKRNCEIKDGRIIVLSPEGQKVEIHEVPAGVDITKIVEAAIKSGADAVKAAADAIGAKAEGPKPA